MIDAAKLNKITSDSVKDMLMYCSLYEASVKGFQLIMASDTFMEMVHAATPVDGFEERMTLIRDTQVVAKDEIACNFNHLKFQAVATTWAVFESWMDKFMTVIFYDQESIKKLTEKKEVFVPLSAMTSTDDFHRCRVYKDYWEETNRVSEYRPDEYIDKVAGCLGKSIKYEKRHSRVIREFASMRNVIMHNHGIIDVGFLENCKWRHMWSRGETVNITPTMFYAYAFGAMWWMYATCAFLVEGNDERMKKVTEALDLSERPILEFERDLA
jgi:hypothetical protein